MTLVYAADIRQTPGDRQESLLNRLPVQMQAKYHSFRRESDRRRFLLGKALLMEGLGRSGLDDLRFTEFNKPYIAGAASFNISHSGDYVLCAFSDDGPVGVDVEHIQTADLDDISRVLTEKEKSSLLGQQDLTGFFYYLWTRKEAIAKADSRGMSLGLEQVDVLEDEVMVPPQKWYLAPLVLPEGYIGHVATTNRLGRAVIPKFIL